MSDGPSSSPPHSDVNPSPSQKPPLEEDPVRAWMLRGIMLALLLWGLYHTLGVFLYNHDPRKALIVFGCSAAFLLCWAMLLLFSGRRSEESQ
jgi:hypothetical protein